MAKTRRNRKPEGAATPPPQQTSKKNKTESFIFQPGRPNPLKGIPEDGFLTMAEVAIGTLVIALLLVTAVLTLRITEKGTVSQKQREDAMDLAKAKSEDLKSYLSSQNWGNMLVDLRFPPTQTPIVSSYNAYAPQTVTLGNNKYIVKPEVRYVYSDATSQMQYVPTPGTAATPEYGDMVRIRVDAYWGPLSQWVPLPTAEAVSNTAYRVVYSNLVTNKTIDVSSTNSITGHVLGWPSIASACGITGSTPLGGKVVGVFQGAQQIMSAISDSNGYFQFQNVPTGTYYVEVISAPGYDPLPGYSCNDFEPVTLTSSQGVTDIHLDMTSIAVWNYYGVLVYMTPGFVQPSTPTPVAPSAIPTAVTPVPNAVVFSNDGNSQPVTSSSSGPTLGGFLITNVRSTPVAGHNYDTIEGDVASPTPVMGQNFNYGLPNVSGTPYPYSISGGQTYIGPITLFVNAAVSGTMPVTFLVLDNDTLGGLPAKYYPVTLNVVDGSASPPSTVLSSGAVTAILNVHQGAPNVSVNLSSNTNPPGYVPFNSAVNINSISTPAPVTLTNLAVGSCAGTVAGMGASFDYSQFKVTVQDSNGQYNYQIPVSYDGASTFGTFNYTAFRTPLTAPYSNAAVYSFSINSGGTFSATNETQSVVWDTAVTLPSPLFLTLLNVYMAVTVTQNGSPYPDGAWVSAQMWPSGNAPGSLPATLGNGYGGGPYFSGLTKGDGTAEIQVQLDGGAATKYTVTAQIVNPASFAVTSQSTTITIPTSASFSNPQGVTFAF